MTRPHRAIAIVLATLGTLLAATTACSLADDQGGNDSTSSAEAATLINPVGPTVISAAGIAHGHVAGTVDLGVRYWKTMDEAIGLLSGGDADFAVLPLTTGVNLRASGTDLDLVAVHEWRAFYLVSAGDASFDGWESLEGRTVYSPEGRGQTVDVMTRYALSRAGITPDQDVTFAYAPAQEIVTLMDAGKIDYAALPEPYVTLALASGGARIGLDFQNYWSEVSGADNGIPVAGLFVSGSYHERYPEAVREVAETFAASVAWGNDNPDDAIEESSDVLPLAEDVVRQALDRMEFRYVAAAESRDDVLEFLTTMRDTYPEGIREIPDESFFVG